VWLTRCWKAWLNFCANGVLFFDMQYLPQASVKMINASDIMELKKGSQQSREKNMWMPLKPLLPHIQTESSSVLQNPTYSPNAPVKAPDWIQGLLCNHFALRKHSSRVNYPAENTSPRGRIPNKKKLKWLICKRKSLSILIYTNSLSRMTYCNGPEFLEMGVNLTKAI
jgi:hypothetical protein